MADEEWLAHVAVTEKLGLILHIMAAVESLAQRSKYRASGLKPNVGREAGGRARAAQGLPCQIVYSL